MNMEEQIAKALLSIGAVFFVPKNPLHGQAE